MRMPAVLISSLLALSSGVGVPLRPPSLASSTAGWGTHTADTGDTVRGSLMLRSAVRLLRTDSLARPLNECPMPVDRPEPGSTVPMPTSRRLMPGIPPIVSGMADAQAGEMPVIRSGCWNPLDRPSSYRDSVRIDLNPRRR